MDETSRAGQRVASSERVGVPIRTLQQQGRNVYIHHELKSVVASSALVGWGGVQRSLALAAVAAVLTQSTATLDLLLYAHPPSPSLDPLHPP